MGLQSCCQLNKHNGNTKWQDSTALEMTHLHGYKTFKDFRKGGKPSKGYRKIRVHLVFDVKHDGWHKSRLVADGTLLKFPLNNIYSGVVSLQGLCLLVFLAELNDLDVWATNIGNAYLKAKTQEKVYIIARPEFGELEGHCSSFSSLFMASGPQASIGMSTLPTASMTWDFNPARQNPTSGCAAMEISMSTLASMSMTLLLPSRTQKPSLICCKTNISSSLRVQAPSASIWVATLLGMKMGPCACLPGSVLRNSWALMSASLVPSPSKISTSLLEGRSS